MINFSIKAFCSYAWNKNKLKNESTAMNILKCIRMLAYAGLFCSWKVKLFEVESIYNQNNNNTIFGKEYKDHLDQRKIEEQHSVEEEKKDMSMVTIVCLSSELMIKIFSLLDQEDIYACRSVSRKWKEFVDDHHLVCRVFSFDFHPLIGRPNRQEAVDQYWSSIRKELKSFSDKGEKLVEKLDMFLVNKFFPEMLSFSINKLLVCSEVFLCKCKEINKTQSLDSMDNVSFSPDGKQFVVISYDLTAQIWKIVDGEWHQKVTIQHFDLINNARFSSDGNYLVTASHDKTAQVWKLVDEKWQKTATLKHNCSIINANFSPNGHYLVTASFDKTAKIWELVDEKWQETAIIKHDKAVANAILSLNGNYLVTTSFDWTAKIWMLVKKEESIVDDASVSNARFNLSENQLVAAPDDEVAETRKIVKKKWKQTFVIDHHQGYINNVSFSPNGNYLVTASDDKTAEICELVENKWHRKATIEHDDWINSANFSPHGTHLVTCSFDGSSKIWGRNVHKKWQEKAIIKNGDTILNANFSSDGMNVVIASIEGVKIWQVEGDQKSNVS